jgi:thiamine-phosphate pyrophosphorylase
MASGCQLYLSIPAGFPGEPSLIEAVLAAGRVPCLLALGAGRQGSPSALRQVAHRQNAALVVENDVGLAKAMGADGVHLRAGGPSPAQAREALGADAIIGADCGLSRHDAMSLAEAGADYVAFGAGLGGDAEAVDDLAEMIDWWSGLIEIPCAAWLPAGAGLDMLGRLAGAGADFILPGPEIWAEPGATAEWVRRAAQACGVGRADAGS